MGMLQGAQMGSLVAASATEAAKSAVLQTFLDFSFRNQTYIPVHVPALWPSMCPQGLCLDLKPVATLLGKLGVCLIIYIYKSWKSSSSWPGIM